MSPVRQNVLAASERGVVRTDELAGVLRMVCFGPTPRQRGLDPDIALLARSAIDFDLHSQVPSSKVQLDMRRTAQRVDDALRMARGDGDETARGTLVSVGIHDGCVHVAHSGHGAALLVRGDDIGDLTTRSDDTTSEFHPWIGARREGDEPNPPLLHCTESPVPLEPGDRLVLLTSPAQLVLTSAEMLELIRVSSPTSLALNLASTVELQTGISGLAVGVIDYQVDVAEENRVLDADLALGLSALIDEITDELEIEPPTPLGPPVRVSRPPFTTPTVALSEPEVLAFSPPGTDPEHDEARVSPKAEDRNTEPVVLPFADLEPSDGVFVDLESPPASGRPSGLPEVRRSSVPLVLAGAAALTVGCLTLYLIAVTT